MDKTTFSKQLGGNIAKYRQNLGWTQEELAEKMHLGNEAISRLERGVTLPSLMRLFDFADVFQCSIVDLLLKNRVAPDNEALYLASLLAQISDKDRDFLINQLEQWVDYLKNHSPNNL